MPVWGLGGVMKKSNRIKRHKLRACRRLVIHWDEQPGHNYVTMRHEPHYHTRYDRSYIDRKMEAECARWEVAHALSDCCGRGLDEYGNLIFPWLKDHAEPAEEPYG